MFQKRFFINLLFIFIWFVFINHTKIAKSKYLHKSDWIDNLDTIQLKKALNILIIDDELPQKKWVDSIMNSMSVKDKIAQLFMVAAYSDKDENHKNYIKNLIIDQKIGGLIFMQGTPYKQAVLNNEYQELSKIPLLIGFDGEWGLNMRLDSTYKYPWNLTLGAITNNQLIEKMGKRIGQQCKRLGIHVNFAPVVDINTNPMNPIIGNRSFGSDKHNVTEKAIYFTKGLQSENVLACAKHFPGHGETDKDSHKTLPTVTLSKDRLFETEMFPYHAMIDNGIAAVMMAHLNVPALEKNPNTPSSLSKTIVTDILKTGFQFEGLIFTDALNMKGASQFANSGQLELKAFLAGNDILLFSENAPAAIDTLYNAFNNKVFDEKRLNHSVRKILNAKYKVGLSQKKLVELTNLQSDLANLEDELLTRALFDNAITLVENNGTYPIENVEQKIGYFPLGNDDGTSFFEMLRKYADVKEIKSIVPDSIKQFDLIIIGYHKSDAHPWKQFQMTDSEIETLDSISNNTKTILSVFTSPYALLKIKDFKKFDNIVISYQNSIIAQELAAQKIFGALKTNGILPVTINDNMPYGKGFQKNAIGRLSYGIPEEVGMSSQKLKKIDSVAQLIIRDKMAPGMQILVARHGKIVYHKTFGYYTYDSLQPVNNYTLYDLASITKITAGLPMVMKAYEDGKITLDESLGQAFPQLAQSNKKDITFREALSHKSGMIAWIPFYKRTLDSLTQKPLPYYYSHTPSDKYPAQVAKDLYVNKAMKDTIWNRIILSEMKSKTYRYSDLFFTIYKDFVERNYQTPLDKIVDMEFYKPLGAYTLTYKPLEKFEFHRIAPTEEDQYFRYQRLQGYVHDMGAALLEGVSGHAGLFGNANDVAKMMQMYLQNGYYGGKQYFKKSTIDTFNYRYYAKEKNRRGLGFDKPQLDKDEKATCGCVSDSSFGHSGFTGNYTWADPESGILYVFLSNRTYPSMDNNKMIKSNIRTEIQRLIQEAIVD